MRKFNSITEILDTMAVSIQNLTCMIPSHDLFIKERLENEYNIMRDIRNSLEENSIVHFPFKSLGPGYKG